MTPLKMFLKVLAHFGMVSTEEKSQMHTDIEELELKCTEDSSNKIYSMYAKLKNNVLARMVTAASFFFIVRAFKNMIADDIDDPFED